VFGYWQFIMWKCDFRVKIILGFRGNIAGGFGQSYKARVMRYDGDGRICGRHC
jgi:hypothetical protein